MKKFIKYICLILVTLIITFSFCSCRQLDEAKANQAFFTENSDSIIEFRGIKYKKLPECKDFNKNIYNVAYVTEKNVPVLLKVIYGKHIHYTEDLMFLFYNGNHYCKEGLYNYYKDMFATYRLDNFCIDKSYSENGKYIEKNLILSENVYNILKSTDEKNASLNNLNTETFAATSVYLCNSNAEFKRFFGDIYYNNNEMYLVKYSDDGKNNAYKIKENEKDIILKEIS